MSHEIKYVKGHSSYDFSAIESDDSTQVNAAIFTKCIVFHNPMGGPFRIGEVDVCPAVLYSGLKGTHYDSI